MLSSRTRLGGAGLSLGTVLLLNAACGDSGSGGATSSTSGTGGMTGTTTGTTMAASTGAGGMPEGIQPPVAGPPMAPDGSGPVVFAISKLYLGDTRRDGTPDIVSGWKSYGYDLDHDISTAASTGLCKPRDSATAANVYPDGLEGRDNAFGKNILPLLLGISSDAPAKVNDSIVMGSGTMMIDLEDLGIGDSYNPLVARYYLGASTGGVAPKFDGTDAWPVKAESLTNAGDLTTAIVTFPGSYVVGNTWVGHVSGPLTLSLGTGFLFFGDFVLHDAVITMDLSADHKHATNGTIAGVLSTNELTMSLKQYAGSFDPTLCAGPTIDSIVTQVQQASDILADGTQDPTKDCDGISAAFGFDA